MNSITANLKNIERLRQLSFTARNLRHLHRQIMENIDTIAAESKQDFSDVKKNMQILAQSLDGLERRLNGLPVILGNAQEIDEIEQKFIYDVAEAATLSQLLDFARLYSQEFWTQALLEVDDEAALRPGLKKLPAERRQQLAAMLTEVNSGT